MGRDVPALARKDVMRVDQPSSWERLGQGVMVLLYHTFALAPLVAIAVLYLTSWRAESVIGHWPQPSVDDPKYIMPNDLFYDSLYLLFLPLILSSFVGLIAVPFFGWLFRQKYPVYWTVFLIAAFYLGLVLLRMDPGDRFTWYMD